jgi:hypothetical protein
VTTFGKPSWLRDPDRFDVPVIVRHGNPMAPGARPRRQRVDAAGQPWPKLGRVAPTGDYLVPTTWRALIDAAVRMGRDPTPWIAWSPPLAWAEIVARMSPLYAFLARTPTGNRSGSGFAVEPNAVFLHGTERTAQGAFGYRVGMTMADWACRDLMGLGPTTHAETGPPPGAGTGWSAESLPDLTGRHPDDGRSWLIEAKGGRKIGLPTLRKGVSQLCRPDLVRAPHIRVLCGASLEHRLTVTLDIESWSPRPHIRRPLTVDENDSYLLDTTRSRMLTYYALSALAPDDLRRLPADSVALVRPGSAEPREMLIGQVPNTGLYLGMSRRLYGACQALATEQRALLPGGDWAANAVARQGMLNLSEDEITERLERRRDEYLRRVRQVRQRLGAVARDGFETAREVGWDSVLGFDVRPIEDVPEQFIGTAGEDTYLAIDGRTPG